ncbi:MAG: MRP family ATP-binding protein, partial [Chitinophagaceae bacterium]
VWRGPMASSAIKQFVTDVNWGDLDYLIIDMPPGTGDIHLTLLQSVPVTGAIVVSTPQEVALADAKKAIAMFGQIQTKVPVLGLIENMSYFIVPGTNTRQYIFGQDGGKKLAEEYELPLLGQIPLNQEIREGGDNGIPVVATNSEVRQAYLEFANNSARSISRRNANLRVSEFELSEGV